MTLEQILGIIERYKLRIPPTVYYELLADVREAEEEQEPKSKFIAKSDGTIEQIKNCNDCLFKKEWEKIGKLISVVLKKQTEQEPNIKALGEELRKVREGIKDGIVLYGYDEAVAICDKYLSETEADNGNDD